MTEASDRSEKARTVRVPERFAPLFEQAERYVGSYFSSLQQHPHRGTLEISGERYVLVRAASMSVEFYEMVSRFYQQEDEARAVTHTMLFDVAHAMGIADAKTFAQRMNVSDPMACLSAGPIHFAHAGWAFVDISEQSSPTPDEDFYLLYDHPYSFESDSWILANKQPDCPVCVMNAGYSSGWCEQCFGLPLAAVEILCRAKGDDVCRFVMAHPDRVERRIADYARENPEFAPSITNYHVPSFLRKHTDSSLLQKNVELERAVSARTQELVAINAQLERDLRERKQTELELSASKELNERLIEALPGGVVQVAKDGALLSANPEALRILGLSYDAFARAYVSDFVTQTVFEDGTPAEVADYPVAKAIATGLTQPAVTLGVRRPDGEIAWAVFRAVPTRDPQTHEITGAVVTFFDITERKRFEDRLRHTQKFESLGVMAGGIAHDFNNLLVAILGNASLAKSTASLDPELAPLLTDIEIGARQAAKLTKQMLDYAGQSKMESRIVDLAQLLREMTTLIGSLFPANVEVHYHVQEGLGAVSADPAQLRQVVLNLATNAAEAMENRTGKVVITVDRRTVASSELLEYLGEVSADATLLCLQVRDEGCGMDEATSSRIFDPFFTTKFTGRGLGLAAVLGIVRGHRGAIRIESEAGVGTTATVLLPFSHGRPAIPSSTEVS